MARPTQRILWMLLILSVLVSFALTRSSLLTKDAEANDMLKQDPTSIIGKLSLSNTKKKPTLVLHVGLPKTATTFLQCVLCQDENRTAPILGQDNYIYLGTCSRSFCQMNEINENFLKHRPDSFFAIPKGYDGRTNRWGALLHDNSTDIAAEDLPELSELSVAKLDQLLARNQNGLIVYEGAHRFSSKHIAALANHVKDNFDVQVVVAYRRLALWLPSKYLSKTRWRGNVKEWPVSNQTEERHLTFDIQNRKEFSDLFEYMEKVQLHPAAIVAQNYQRHFNSSAFTIMDLHHLWTASSATTETSSGDPLLQDLFCKVIPNAPYTCQAAIQDRLGRPSDEAQNSAWDLSFDEVAVKAHLAGMIPQTNYNNETLGRFLVTKRVSKFYAAVQAKRQDSYQRPLKCLPNSTQDRILNLSIRTEKKLLGDTWSAEMEKRMEEEHRLAFDTQKSKLVCSVHVEKMIGEELWQDFFASFTDAQVDKRLHELYPGIDAKRRRPTRNKEQNPPDTALRL